MDTIDSAISKIGFGKFHVISGLILGGQIMYFSFQMIIISLIGLLLKCQWKIDYIEIYLLTTVSFLGLLAGSLLFGKPSDKYGRKKTLLVSNIGTIYFTIIGALSPTIAWITFIQFVTNIFVVGIILSAFPLMSEFLPDKFRGTFMIVFQLFLAFGSLFLTLLCFLIVPVFGWRALLVVSVIPLVCCSIGLIFIPESPRVLLLRNNKTKCIRVINQIARMNKSKTITDILVTHDSNSSFRDLTHPNYLWTTILTILMCFIGGLSLYSMVLLVPIIDTVPHMCLQNMSTYSILRGAHRKSFQDSSCCFRISFAAFKDMFISISAEFIFIIIALILINFIGRKKIFSFFLVILIIGFFLLNFCMTPIQLSILLFFLRGAATGFFILCNLYATEVFPTSVRGLGLGLCSFSSRIGGIMSPFIVNIIIAKVSFLVGTLVLCILNCAALIACFFLPYETKDRKLYQTASHEENEAGSVDLNYKSVNNK